MGMKSDCKFIFAIFCIIYNLKNVLSIFFCNFTGIFNFVTIVCVPLALKSLKKILNIFQTCFSTFSSLQLPVLQPYRQKDDLYHVLRQCRNLFSPGLYTIICLIPHHAFLEHKPSFLSNLGILPIDGRLVDCIWYLNLRHALQIVEEGWHFWLLLKPTIVGFLS